jgi:hypothetical protein
MQVQCAQVKNFENKKEKGKRKKIVKKKNKTKMESDEKQQRGKRSKHIESVCTRKVLYTVTSTRQASGPSGAQE